MQKNTMSRKQLSIIGLSIMLVLVLVLGITLGALKDSKTATGTIVFTGNLAVVLDHGNTIGTVNGTNLELDLIPDYTTLKEASESGNIYLQDKEGKIVSLKWEDNTEGGNALKFRVISDGATNAYIKMTLTLQYTSAGNAPTTAQEWQVYPKFGSEAYELKPTMIGNGVNEEYSYYNATDGLMISYPLITQEGNTVSKVYEMYYEMYYIDTVNSGLKYFEPTDTTANVEGYTKLNKEIVVGDIISDIQFLISGVNSVSSGDEFKLNIKCEATTFVSL